jgi:5'-nucleotidase
MNETKYHILLVNDDGINSPGLWAAAEALAPLGYVTVAAPRSQWSGAGRCLPGSSDGVIKSQTLNVNGKEWTVYAVGGSPAQTVIHAVQELCPRKPDLVVSGINYGENCGSGATSSGTVGAALEAASFGIPAIAVSLEVVTDDQLSFSSQIDFEGAKYFTALFAEKMLGKKLPADVDVIKIEVPDDAGPQTAWKMTRLARKSYYRLYVKPRTDLEKPEPISYEVNRKTGGDEPNSDNHAIMIDRMVAVTPLSLDLTSRIELKDLEDLLR